MKHLLITLLCMSTLHASQRSASAPVQTYDAAPGSFASQLNQLAAQGHIDTAIVEFLTATSEAVDRVKQNLHADNSYELVLQAQEKLANEKDIKVSNEQFLKAAEVASRLIPECLLTWKLLFAYSAHRGHEIGGEAGNNFHAAIAPFIGDPIYNSVYQFGVANSFLNGDLSMLRVKHNLKAHYKLL